MSKVMQVLKAEIVRLARREVRQEVRPLRRLLAERRRQIAELRRQNRRLQKELAALRRKLGEAQPMGPVAAEETAERFWISGQGVRALRRRLGLTQASLAKLAKVSLPAVVNWEKKPGKLRLRKATAAKLREIRRMKKFHVLEILGPKGGRKRRPRTEKKPVGVKKTGANKRRRGGQGARRTRTP